MTAWRLWRPAGSSHLSTPVSSVSPDGPVHVAVCPKRADHVPPAVGCVCGIYAFPELADCVSWAETVIRPRTLRGVALVFGRVELSGPVLPATQRLTQLPTAVRAAASTTVGT